MRRPALCVAAVVAALVPVVGACDTDPPFAPPLPSAAGYREVGGALRIWTGTPCTGVTRVAVTYTMPDDSRERLVLTAPPPGVTLEHLDVARPGARFTVEERPSAAFDWRDAEQASLVIDATEPAWGSVVDLADVVDGSAEHDPQTYLFDDLGWKSPADVAAQNAESFLTVCTPAPG